MALLIMPLSLTVPGKFNQLVVARLVFCSRTKPVEGDGHETTPFMPDQFMVSKGEVTVLFKANKVPPPHTPPSLVVPDRILPDKIKSA